MRFSLKAFLLITAIAGAYVGVKARYVGDGFADIVLSTAGGTPYRCILATHFGRLEYCVVIPDFVESGGSIGGMYPKEGPSDPDYVDVCSKGLFIGGQRIRLDSRIYVLTTDHKVRRIEITEEEYEQIAEGIDPNLPFWQQKVDPVIEEESHRAKRALFER